MKHLLVLLFIFVLSLLIIPAQVVNAADVEVTCGDSSCTPSSVASFFPSDLWYPGKTVTRSMLINNSSAISRSFGIWATDVVSAGYNADEEFNLEIKRNQDSLQLWTGSLADLYAGSEIILDDISGGQNKEFDFILTLNNSAVHKDISTSFDMVFGFLVPTPTPTSVPGPTSTPVPGPTSTPVPPTSTPPVGGETAGAAGGTAGFAPLIPGILGAENLPQEGQTQGVMTASAVCRQSWWWPLVLLMQTQIIFMLVKFGKKRFEIPSLLIQTSTTFLSLITLSHYFCFWWLIPVSGMIGTVGIILTSLKPNREYYYPNLNLFTRSY